MISIVLTIAVPFLPFLMDHFQDIRLFTKESHVVLLQLFRSSLMGNVTLFGITMELIYKIDVSTRKHLRH
jgi:hypothetical protein